MHIFVLLKGINEYDPSPSLFPSDVKVRYEELIVFLTANLFPPEEVTVVDVMMKDRSEKTLVDFGLAKVKPPFEKIKSWRIASFLED